MDADRKLRPSPEEDELVPLARIVKESGWPTSRVRLALGEAGDRLRIYHGEDSRGREDRRKKLYPLAYTLSLLREKSEREIRPEIEEDERVTFDRVVAELGWTRNTARHYLAEARRLVFTFPDPEDSRKKFYPLRYTVKLLQREHGRVRARRLRRKDEGAGYWAALATLKVAAGRLRQLSTEASALSKEVRAAFEGLRKRPPLVVEIHTLPDPGLALVHSLMVLVGPLRKAFWRAAVPEISLQGVGSTPEGAVTDLREKLAEKYRQLQLQPSLEPDLWQHLSELVRPKRPRRKPAGDGSHEVNGDSSQ